MAIPLAIVTTVVVNAQAHPSNPNGPAPNGPAQVLVTARETLKPGDEAAHARLEAEYAAVLNANHGSEYYLGMGAISGKQQMVFLSGYSSLEEMADVHDYNETTLGDKLDKIDGAHGSTLTGVDTAIWRLRPDLSNPDAENLGKMRFMELTRIHVKLGHNPDFVEMMKLVKAQWNKTDPDFHYLFYRQVFGNSKDDTYLVVIAVKSLADLDKHHALIAKFQQGLGEEAYKHLLEFQSANYDGTVSNLFVFTPEMSRLPASWIKDDLDFWAPEPPLALPTKKGTAAQK
jgi:hypothetical protein